MVKLGLRCSSHGEKNTAQRPKEFGKFLESVTLFNGCFNGFLNQYIPLIYHLYIVFWGVI